MHKDGSHMFWICECKAGFCEFKTKNEALDNNHGKFCGKWISLKRRKVTTASEVNNG